LTKSLFEALSASERLRLAKGRTERLVDQIVHLFLMHASNASIVYSQKLSAQIPRSHAAHAFNQFRRSMHLFEIIRLCALWDKASKDRESIPTIIKLFNKPELIDHIVDEARAPYANECLPDTLKNELADQMAETTRCKLNFFIRKAGEIQDSRQLNSMRCLRDRYIAHNLDVPYPSSNDEASVEKLKYGDETYILDATVEISVALHQCLNRTGFQWEDSREIARRNARSLWDHCTFQIPTRSGATTG
jgi:hypothetical protein